MRTPIYWIGQYLLAAGTMFLLLAAIDLIRGYPPAETLPATLGWSCAAAAIFVASRYRQALRGDNCALCKDDKRAGQAPR